MENENKIVIPWQFSTIGMVLGFFFGFAPLLISLLGNHQIKQKKDVADLKNAYNILLILSIVSIVVLFLFMFLAVLASIPARHSY